MRPVVVVGTVNRDLVLRVDALPLPGQTVLGRSLTAGSGGKGGNQAAAAASAGAPTRLLAAVGDDEAGAACLADLRRAGVDVALVQQRHGPTGTAVVVVDGAGANSIVAVPGANDLLEPELVAASLAGEPGDAVCLCSAEVSDDVVDAALTAAAARGWPSVYNVAPSRPLTPAQVAARPVLVVNETEAADLSGQPDPASAAALLADRLGAPVVVTLGAAGALLAVGTGGAVQAVPSPPADVVDTTGAGDVFCGTLAARLAAGEPLADAVAAACAAGSEATTWPGARRPLGP